MLAMWLLALDLTQLSNSFCNTSFCPLAAVKRKKRNLMPSSLWVATNVPLPWRRIKIFSPAKLSIALRTVP